MNQLSQRAQDTVMKKAEAQTLLDDVAWALTRVTLWGTLGFIVFLVCGVLHARYEKRKALLAPDIHGLNDCLETGQCRLVHAQCKTCGARYGEYVARWEFPLGYTPPANGVIQFRTMTRDDEQESWRSGPSCRMQLTHKQGKMLGGKVYECSFSAHPGFPLENIEFRIVIPNDYPLELLEPKSWPTGVALKGSTRFGAVRIWNDDSWSSTCSESTATNPTDCIARPVEHFPAILAIASMP